jgi:hypothetical protein
VGMGKLMLFVCGLLFGVVGAFGTVVYLETHKPPQDDQLVFAQKNFWDSKQTGVDGYVGISGTLTGKDMGYPNNTYAVSRIASYFGCYRVTMTIDRKREAFLWVNEPINQTKPSCKDADTTIRKYTIEDSPGWKKIFGKK